MSMRVLKLEITMGAQSMSYRRGASFVKDLTGVGSLQHNIFLTIDLSTFKFYGKFLRKYGRPVLCTQKSSIKTTYCICTGVRNYESQDLVGQDFHRLVIIESRC